MDDVTRARWAAELAAKAKAYWTPERTTALAGGKALRILPADAPELLRALGLLADDATLPPARVRKFLQVNHMVGVLAPSLAELCAAHPVVRVVDAGCGRSYLTLLLAWHARALGHRVEVLGVDRNPALIDEARRRTELAGLADVVKHEAVALEDLDVTAAPPHALFALHACDTATCDALALGVRAGAELIAVAPCCQAELARAWTALDAAGTAGAFATIWGAPHLRRELAAHLTDTMRVQLLRAAGYAVTAMEFIAPEHTVKNTLVRAQRRGTPDPSARAAYDALVAATGGAGLGLAARI
jgi:SAM-dependent methyltransferase